MTDSIQKTDNQGSALASGLGRSYPWQQRLRRIQHVLAVQRPGQRVLCVGAPVELEPALRQLGNEWTFVPDDFGSATFPPDTFDCAVLIDCLEFVEDDYAFMTSIHHALKAAGMLYIDALHTKRWTVWRPFRRLFGVEPRADDRARLGYTESSLFDLLKDGFDVQETRTTSRFFSEGVETALRLALAVFGVPGFPDPDDEGLSEQAERRFALIHAIHYPFFVVAGYLDWLVFFTRGYRLNAVARRRLWKPRRAPVLRDGRTLADATLNTRIGTAAPF